MKKLFIFILFILSLLNITAQIKGNDILDPIFNSNPVCIYLKDFSNTMSCVIYNNYEDSLVYIHNVYLINNDYIQENIQINNNHDVNTFIFNINEYETYDIIITTNKDNWKITFDNFSKYKWYDMELCIFTNIKPYFNNFIYTDKIYDLNGIQINNSNIELYIFKRKKYIIR